MIIHAVLGNPNHPEYGVATIPFHIPHDQYAHCMELLEALEIGDALKADCQVEEIDSFYSVLKRTEKLTVNVEELNYLAKRLDSFDAGEAAQFQAMAHKLELSELKDLINLFDFAPDAHSPAEYGKYMIQQSGHYEFDENLDEFYDYEGYAQQRINDEDGMFTDRGYIAYKEYFSLEKIMEGGQGGSMEMGGMV